MAAPLEIKENTILVILGASGDLAKKKLVNLPVSKPLFSANCSIQFPALFGLVSPPAEKAQMINPAHLLTKKYRNANVSSPPTSKS